MSSIRVRDPGTEQILVVVGEDRWLSSKSCPYNSSSTRPDRIHGNCTMDDRCLFEDEDGFRIRCEGFRPACPFLQTIDPARLIVLDNRFVKQIPEALTDYRFDTTAVVYWLQEQKSKIPGDK